MRVIFVDFSNENYYQNSKDLNIELILSCIEGYYSLYA